MVNRLPHDCTAYGLHVRSPIALPFAPRPGRPAGAPDVVVRFDPTPAALPAPARVRKKVGIQWEAASGAFLMNVDGAARYLVSDGRDILVELCGGSDSEIVGSLTGQVFAALLQQRGVMTFHASAIETRAGAVLFAGHSGAGKSSLIAALIERGYTMLADDVTGVVLDPSGRPEARAAFPATRLWADTVHTLDWHGRTRGRVHETLEKYLVPVERFCTSPRVARRLRTGLPRPGRHRGRAVARLRGFPSDFWGFHVPQSIPGRARAAARTRSHRGCDGKAGARRAGGTARSSVPARRADGSDRGAACRGANASGRRGLPSGSGGGDFQPRRLKRRDAMTIGGSPG